jgi:hypothetical protein
MTRKNAQIADRKTVLTMVRQRAAKVGRGKWMWNRPYFADKHKDGSYRIKINFCDAYLAGRLHSIGLEVSIRDGEMIVNVAS